MKPGTKRKAREAAKRPALEVKERELCAQIERLRAQAQTEYMQAHTKKRWAIERKRRELEATLVEVRAELGAAS